MKVGLIISVKDFRRYKKLIVHLARVPFANSRQRYLKFLTADYAEYADRADKKRGSFFAISTRWNLGQVE